MPDTADTGYDIVTVNLDSVFERRAGSMEPITPFYKPNQQQFLASQINDFNIKSDMGFNISPKNMYDILANSRPLGSDYDSQAPTANVRVKRKIRNKRSSLPPPGKSGAKPSAFTKHPFEENSKVT